MKILRSRQREKLSRGVVEKLREENWFGRFRKSNVRPHVKLPKTDPSVKKRFTTDKAPSSVNFDKDYTRKYDYLD